MEAQQQKDISAIFKELADVTSQNEDAEASKEKLKQRFEKKQQFNADKLNLMLEEIKKIKFDLVEIESKLQKLKENGKEKKPEFYQLEEAKKRLIAFNSCYEAIIEAHQNGKQF